MSGQYCRYPAVTIGSLRFLDVLDFLDSEEGGLASSSEPPPPENSSPGRSPGSIRISTNS